MQYNFSPISINSFLLSFYIDSFSFDRNHEEFAMKIRKSKGFTLIELMVVVAIIGVLLATAVPQYQKYQMRGALSTALDAAGPIKLAYENYAKDNGEPPDNESVFSEFDNQKLDASNTITCNAMIKDISINANHEILIEFWAGTVGESTDATCPQDTTGTPSVLRGETIKLLPLKKANGTLWVVDTADGPDWAEFLPSSVPTNS
jgi:type IV pilus assembly protein PilA